MITHLRTVRVRALTDPEPSIIPATRLGVVAWRRLLLDSRYGGVKLNKHALLVAHTLAGFMNADGETFASLDSVAKSSWLGKATVHKYMAQLRRVGLLSRYTPTNGARCHTTTMGPDWLIAAVAANKALLTGSPRVNRSDIQAVQRGTPTSSVRMNPKGVREKKAAEGGPDHDPAFLLWAQAKTAQRGGGPGLLRRILAEDRWRYEQEQADQAKTLEGQALTVLIDSCPLCDSNGFVERLDASGTPRMYRCHTIGDRE